MSKSGLLPIEKAVFDALKNNFSNKGKLRFIVGVSGGIDSTCLLHIFSELNVEAVGVHINYGTRGEASDKDAAFVEKVCNDLGVSCILHEVDAGEAENSNFQAWARNIRYDLFEKEAQKAEATGIAVAHNQDDQIETILQKIFRGSGLAGWSGMKIWNGQLFRPLLKVSRNEIKEYCEEKSISFRLDETNLTSAYSRNFLRNEWLPQLQKNFPGWRTNVLRVEGQAEVFKSMLSYILDDVSDGKAIIRKPFLALPLPLQKSVLLHFIKKKEVNSSVSIGALSQMEALNTLQTGRKVQLNDDLFLIRDRSKFKIVHEDLDLPEPKLLQYEDLKNNAVIYEGFEFSLRTFSRPNFKSGLYLDSKKLQWPVKLRPWKRGDKIQPLGMKGRQSIADHLTNRKISAAKKRKVIVVQSFEETIAAVIFPAIKDGGSAGSVSELFKCSDSTTQSLIIKPET